MREAYSLLQLGSLDLAEARHEQAITQLRRALAIRAPTSRPLPAARVLATLGDAYQAAGDQGAAYSCHHRALVLFQQLEVPEAEQIARRLAEVSGPPTQHPQTSRVAAPGRPSRVTACPRRLGAGPVTVPRRVASST